MQFLGIVVIGSMLIGVIVFIAILHGERKKRFVLQSEIEALKKVINQDETKKDIELRVKELKELASSVVEEINENAENKLNTLSNKKIMEFEEYANEVLQKIDINHKEVMFLYDMLNDKVDSVNKLINKLEEHKLEMVSKDSSVEDIKEVVEDNIEADFARLFNDCNTDTINQDRILIGDSDKVFSMDKVLLVDSALGEDELVEEYFEEEISIGSVLREQAAIDKEMSIGSVPSEHASIGKEVSMRNGYDKQEYVSQKVSTNKLQERQNRQCNVKEVLENNDDKESIINSYQKRNEQIIKLYSLGYSTVDISKKLGIGTGEVALVNNLYHDRLVIAK